MRPTFPRFLTLQAEGTALVLELTQNGLPVVLHWGADLGALTDADLAALSTAVSRQSAPGTLDAAWQLSILPQESDDWAALASSSHATVRASSRAGR